LSTQVSIAGRMLVYLPQEKHIGISQRIEKEAEREALREKLARLVPEDEPGGFIVRTMAESASEAELAKDIEYLRKIWRDIQAQSTTAAPPALLYQELSLAQRVLRDFVNPETSGIVIDSRENFQRLTTLPPSTRRLSRPCSSTTPGSDRCSTCTASRTRSRRHWPAGSISSRAAT
jgi:ribonuclease G